MYLWRVRRNNGRRVGGWDGTVQCTDSACASSVAFPDSGLARTGIPREANTLRVVIYGRGSATGVDIPLAANQRS